MIAARKAAGITNQSSFEKKDLTGGIGFEVTGSNGKVLVTLGYVTDGVPEGYDVVVAGDATNNDFCFYVSNNVSIPETPAKANYNLGTARVDMASGTYYESVTVNISPSDDFTTLVYTEDGSDPTTSSTTITSTGKSITYNEVGTHILKVGVTDGNSVRDVQTYRYVVTNEVPTDITIYVRADKEPIYLYAWDANGELTSAWPGTQLSAKKSVDGVNFYYMTFPKSSADYTLNYILNQGGDETKTPDQTGIGSTIFTALGDGAAIDLTATYAGLPIEEPVENPEAITVYVKGDFGPAYLYTWNGVDLGAWPGTKMSTTLINGETWFYHTMPEGVTSFDMIVNQGVGQTKSPDYTGVTSTVYLQYHGTNNLTVVEGMEEYPRQGWYEQGEVCAFFVNDGWDANKTISAYLFNGSTEYAGGWPGTACTLLGYNEDGSKIWKWNYNGTSLPTETKIIFTNKGDSGNDQLANCKFENGAWYYTSNTGNNITPVSTDVASMS